MNKKRLIIIGLILLAVIVLLGIFFSNRPNKKTTEFPPQIEQGSATSTIALNGADRLSQILLPQEFTAVKKTLTGYIRANVGKNILSAQVVPGSTVIKKDNSVNFSIRIQNPNKSLDIVLQRPDATTIIFYVKGANSEPTTLYPFSSNQ